MREFNAEDHYEEETILKDIITILEDISSGWEMQFGGSIGPQTLLGADLAFKSVDLVRLIGAIQKRYDRHDLPFKELVMSGDRPVKDVRVSDLVDFLHNHLNHE